MIVRKLIHRFSFAVRVALAFVCCFVAQRVRAEELPLHLFTRHALTTEYYSEGANAGDLNRDGKVDVVSGPYWYEGPDWKVKHAIYPPQPQNREGYADNFFSWVYDFNQDGWNDVFVVGFPGTPAYVYENPGAQATDQPWTKHEVFDWVSNESPHFTQLVGDATPELVCTRDGFFGYAVLDLTRPWEPWKFHAISAQIADGRFGHGLGVGDVNGDGRLDVLHPHGWFEQPAQSTTAGRWTAHDAEFTNSYGGAEMYAYDVDGDGDQDVITSLAAHDYGLAWYEQTVSESGQRAFQQHLIMGSHPAENRYGLVFTELHSMQVFDMDGDGLKDIVTGKTYYSHHRQSPLWDAGAWVVWFRLVRTGANVDWVPYVLDREAGIGRQVSIVDVNADQLPDIVVGGMKGAHVLTHQRTLINQVAWEAAQPVVYQGPPAPSAEGAEALRGPQATLDASTQRADQVVEGESLQTHVTHGAAQSQEMSGFKDGQWSNRSHLFWTGGRPGDRLSTPVSLPDDAKKLELVLTCAPDYGVVQVWLDDQRMGPPINLFEAKVIPSGVLSLDLPPGVRGQRTLTFEVVGADANAVKSYYFGIDWLRVH